MNSSGKDKKQSVVHRSFATPLLMRLQGYGLAVFLVSAALGMSFLLERFHFRDVADPLFLIAIAITVWYAGTGPAILAVVLSGLADAYFFIEPRSSLYITRDDLVHFVIFILFASLLTGFAAVRRHVEAELLQARNKLEIEVAERTQQASLLNLTHDTIFVRDMNEIITYWNRGAEELYGWSPEEAIGKSSHELLRTVFPSPLEEIRTELLGTGHWEGELKHTKADGTEVVVASRWSLRRDVQERPVAVLETINDITARKRWEEREKAEEALRRSERELRQVIETIPAMVWSALPDASNVSMNRRWTEYTGLSAAGLDWQAAVHPGDLKRHMDAFRACSAAGLPFEDEVRFRRADGEYRWFFVRGMPLRDEQGNLLKWYGIVTDIEDRKRSEEALRRSETYLAEAQRLSHASSWAWNPVTGKNLYWSEEQFRIWGFDPQQGLPDTEAGFQRIHPEDRNRISEEMRQRLLSDLTEKAPSDSSKADLVNDFRIVLPDGTVKYIHSVSHAVLDETGEVIEYLGTSVDVTERKRAEQELAGRLRQQAIVAELGQYALATPDLQVIMEKAVNLLADSLDVEYTKVLELLPDGKALHLRAGVGWKEGVVGSATVGADTNSQIGYTLLSAGPVIVEDLRREAQFTGPPLLRDHGVVSGMSVIIGGGEQPWGVLGAHTSRRRDFTKDDIQFLQAVANIIAHGIQRERAEEERERLRQLEAELAHINRVSMMGELTASLAHEIRQPIAAAITSADACLRWLTHNPPDLERARLAVARIKEDGTRADDVINRLRSFYKKGTPPERELVDVNEVVREMIVLLRNEAMRYSVSVRPELAEGIPKVRVDRVQLQQVFMNLMLNAIEAMKETGGALTIKSHLGQDGRLMISVSDTGVGLPAENAERIFDAFYTTKPQGSGMGLAISRSIVESHGGRLWATANDGPGTTFNFTLRNEAGAHA
jgi:PAS domain S-box-containing protein